MAKLEPLNNEGCFSTKPEQTERKKISITYWKNKNEVKPYSCLNWNIITLTQFYVNLKSYGSFLAIAHEVISQDDKKVKLLSYVAKTTPFGPRNGSHR